MSTARHFYRSLLILAGLTLPLQAKIWTDASGHYQVDAEEIAFNDKTVVLKKPSGELIAFTISDLSAKDQEYVRSKETADKLGKSADQMQTWTAKDGLKVRARVLAYGRSELKLQRKLGKVTINDKPFSTYDPIHQKLILKVVSHLGQVKLEDEKGIDEWGKQLGGEPRTYKLEGVRMQLESGDEIPVPFFLFAPEELAILEPGWNRWKEEKRSDEEREHESFLMQSSAMAYQQDRQHQRQVEMVKLELLAAATGLISIWEIRLVPKPGVYAVPMHVIVPGLNSQVAVNLALSKYPGYVVGGIRRANR